MNQTQPMNGLGQCYLAGLPFFRNALAGGLYYSGILFGSLEWVQTHFRWLRDQQTPFHSTASA